MSVETIAVSATNLLLSVSDKVLTDLKQGDKFPSFDGDIVYSPHATKADSVFVRTQIKGVTVGSLDDLKVAQCSYSLSLIDLKNYMNNGGVLLFVVLCYRTEYEVFAASLLPIWLKRLIQTAGDQKTKTVHLRKIPKEVEAWRIDELILNHHQQAAMQAGFVHAKQPVIDHETLAKGRDITICYTSIANNLVEAMTHVIGKELHQYLTSPDFPIPIPLEETETISELRQESPLAVSVGDEVFYDSVGILVDKTGPRLLLGDSITIDIDASSGSPIRLNFSQRGSISNCRKALRFLYAAAQSRIIRLGSGELLLGRDATKKSLDDFGCHEQLEFCTMAFELICELDDDPDEADISHVTNHDVEWVSRLYDAIIRGTAIQCSGIDGDSYCVPVRFLGRTYFIFHERLNDDFFSLCDLRKIEVEIHEQLDDGSHLLVSRFGPMGASVCLEASNVSADELIDSYITAGRNPSNDRLANDQALAFIDRFDREGHIADLDAANELLSWLGGGDPTSVDPLVELNILQVKYRKGQLEPSDIDRLRTIAKDDEKTPKKDRVVYVAAMLLLDNKDEAKTAFRKLTADNRENIESFPIGHLLNGKARMASEAVD